MLGGREPESQSREPEPPPAPSTSTAVTTSTRPAPPAPPQHRRCRRNQGQGQPGRQGLGAATSSHTEALEGDGAPCQEPSLSNRRQLGPGTRPATLCPRGPPRVSQGRAAGEAETRAGLRWALGLPPPGLHRLPRDLGKSSARLCLPSFAGRRAPGRGQRSGRGWTLFSGTAPRALRGPAWLCFSLFFPFCSSFQGRSSFDAAAGTSMIVCFLIFRSHKESLSFSFISRRS